MKQLGSKALQKIQNLIVAKEPKPRPSPVKQKSVSNFRPSKIVEDTPPPAHKASQKTPKKSPTKSPKVLPRSSSPVPPPSFYIPREKEIKMLQKQTKAMYSELEQRVNYRVQNTHSFFLNQRNPRPPIYQRAQDIIRQREAILEEKRQAKIREKQQAEERQYEQYLKSQMSKRVLSKSEAEEVGDRLYKEYYLKTHRLNQQKIDRYMEQAKYYRDKPFINSTSHQIYQVVAEKHKLRTDIIDRFGQYEMEKAEKNKETMAEYQNKYTPFKPNISEQSRVLISTRDDPSHSLSRSKHCLSCHYIKANANAKNSTSPLRSIEQSTMRDRTSRQ